MLSLRDHHADAIEVVVQGEEKELYLPPADVHFSPQTWNLPNIANTIGPWAYGLDLPEIGKAKPGYLSREPWIDTFVDEYPQTPEEFAIAIQKDGLLYYGDFIPDEGHIIAAFAKPGTTKKLDQTLIARRDSNGLWSYTAEGGGCGDYYPQQVDLRGAPVTDIRKAYFCGFDIFLGIAAIPYKGISYHRRVEMPNESKTLLYRDIPACSWKSFDF